MKSIALFSIGCLIAIIGLIVVMQPSWLCGIANIGCEGGFARDCLRARGSKTEFTPGLSPSGDSFSAHLGGKEEISGAQNAEELELILNCVREAYAQSSQKDDYITDGVIQLGLVEQQWREGEVALDIIEPADSQSRDNLMNMAFGPAGGKRSEIIEQWCSDNSSCVACKSSSDSSSYAVSVKPSAVFEKSFNGTAPLSGHRKEPFQLIEADESLGEGIGRRVVYLCSNE